MKIKDLIEQLQKLPQEDEIMVLLSDDILGYYDYVNPEIYETDAIKTTRGFHATYSNNAFEGKTVNIWIIGS